MHHFLAVLGYARRNETKMRTARTFPRALCAVSWMGSCQCTLQCCSRIGTSVMSPAPMNKTQAHTWSRGKFNHGRVFGRVPCAWACVFRFVWSHCRQWSQRPSLGHTNLTFEGADFLDMDENARRFPPLMCTAQEEATFLIFVGSVISRIFSISLSNPTAMGSLSEGLQNSCELRTSFDFNAGGRINFVENRAIFSESCFRREIPS